jgi:hypothetical protein
MNRDINTSSVKDFLSSHGMKSIKTYFIPECDKNNVLTGRVLQFNENSFIYKQFIEKAGRLPNSITILN